MHKTRVYRWEQLTRKSNFSYGHASYNRVITEIYFYKKLKKFLWNNSFIFGSKKLSAIYTAKIMILSRSHSPSPSHYRSVTNFSSSCTMVTLRPSSWHYSPSPSLIVLVVTVGNVGRQWGMARDGGVRQGTFGLLISSIKVLSKLLIFVFIKY